MNPESDQATGERIELLVREALKLEGEARAAFLRDSCHDNVREAVLERLRRAESATERWQAGPTRTFTGEPPERETDGAVAAGPLGDTAAAAGPPEDSSAAADPVVESPPRLAGYKIRGELGRGGMGVVYRALHEPTGRTVALKIIRPDRFQLHSPRQRQAAIERFRNEAQAAARLDHDHIVTVYEVGEEGGVHYYAMRFVEGRRPLPHP